MNAQRLLVDTAQGPALAGLWCAACGAVSFPVRTHCPGCLAEERLEVRALSRRGRLFAFTIAEVGTPGLIAPYAFGFVDLDCGLRVFSLLEDAELLRDGIDLDLMVDGEGRYRFKPSRE